MDMEDPISETRILKEEIQGLQKDIADRDWGIKKTNESIRILYKDLEEKNAELKKLDQLKSDFVSTVSHELRTPLSITTEGINLILDGLAGPINDMQKDLLQTSKESLDRLKTIINDLLDISKIEAGKIEIRKGFVDLKEILQKLTDSYRRVLSTKKQDMRVVLPEGKVFLFIDGDKMIQVVTNLLNNAHKFTPEDGLIEVTLTVEPKQVRFKIRDSGVGISQEDIPKLFGKFEQFGRTHGSGIKGTGLGLAISKALIELHGGKIWAESKINEGTTFQFTLPDFEEAKVEFDKYVDVVLKNTLSKQQTVSFLVIHLANFHSLQEKHGNKAAIGAMNVICSVVGQTVTRPSDKFIVYQENTIHIILHRTGKEGGFSVIARLKEAIQESSFETVNCGALDLKFGIAVYPAEAADRISLEKAAYHHLERKKKVLFVDDEPEILRILQLNLEKLDISIEFAKDGVEAMESIMKSVPDLIVTDITMPRMNGYELLGRLKGSARTSSTPVIILTAKRVDDIQREHKEFGNIPVFEKTGDFTQITTLISEMF